MNLLPVTIIQTNLIWEDKIHNCSKFEEFLNSISCQNQLVILPEMFSTGFSMNSTSLAETMTGTTIAWMKNMASLHKCILCGSMIIEDNGKYYNRLLWVQPDHTIYHYDKRHLFSLAGEDKHYTPGNQRIICSVGGWKVNLQICYDLRFPVWNRQQNPDEYDILLYVANWPERRAEAWNTLLKARAIENQCYVIAANRVGTDGNGIYHKGDSQIISPLGEVLQHVENSEAILQYKLNKETLTSIKKSLPFLNDKDDFIIY